MNLPNVSLDPAIESLLEENKKLKWELLVLQAHVQTYAEALQAVKCDGCPEGGCDGCPEKSEG